MAETREVLPYPVLGGEGGGGDQGATAKPSGWSSSTEPVPVSALTGDHPSRGPTEYFVVDFRKEWTRQPYITLWGPGSCGYNWSLSHAGRYTADELDRTVGYHTRRRYVASRGSYVGPWERFGVPCEVLERIGTEPDTEGRWRLDNGGRPIVRNSAAIRKMLVANRYVPAEQRKQSKPVGPKHEVVRFTRVRRSKTMRPKDPSP